MAVPKRRTSISKVKLGYKKNKKILFKNRILSYNERHILEIIYDKLIWIPKEWIQKKNKKIR
jgi:hypothetical protein